MVRSPRLFCFGLGYTAAALARLLLAAGWQVSGTCRTSEKAVALAEAGLPCAAFDGTPPPAQRLEDANLPPFAAHFYAECKRVRNDLIKRFLGVVLRYPSYRDGLDAILERTAHAGHTGAIA